MIGGSCTDGKGATPKWQDTLTIKIHRLVLANLGVLVRIVWNTPFAGNSIVLS
jgi:hypothetical protein